MKGSQVLLNENYLYSSCFISNHTVKIKIAKRNSNDTTKGNEKLVYRGLSVDIDTFMDYELFTNAISKLENQERKIDCIFLMEKKSELKRFENSNDWENFFNENPKYVESSQIKLEYTLKSSSQTFLENEICTPENRLEFFGILKHLASTDVRLRQRIKEEINKRKINQESKDLNNDIIINSLFNSIEEKLEAHLRIDQITSSMKTRDSSGLTKSEVPAFLNFYKDEDIEQTKLRIEEEFYT